MRSYTQERRVFDRLKSDCSDEAKQEYELAFDTLLTRYNTTIHENRFVVGGAVSDPIGIAGRKFLCCHFWGNIVWFCANLTLAPVAPLGLWNLVYPRFYKPAAPLGLNDSHESRSRCFVFALPA